MKILRYIYALMWMGAILVTFMIMLAPIGLLILHLSVKRDNPGGVLIAIWILFTFMFYKKLMEPYNQSHV